MGLVYMIAAFIPGYFLLNIPAQFFQILGWTWVALVFSIITLGVAGIAAEISLRLNWKNDGAFQSLGAFLRGAILFELAALFPVIGWLLIFPIGTITALGAAVPVILKKETMKEELIED